MSNLIFFLFIVVFLACLPLNLWGFGLLRDLLFGLLLDLFICFIEPPISSPSPSSPTS